mgnify:FL=1|tara:strand:+ start:480 stop:860 length:381 start_codon:yes stop_codon:yes gene_type:complete
MKIKTGSMGFHVAFKVPNSETKRMEEFLDKHESFMKETHHIEGDIEPIALCYAVMKCPELNNPLDPKSGETGFTLYGLTEIYSGPEGVQMHMQLGQERKEMFMELVELTNEYCVSGIIGAPVIKSM